MWGWTSRSKTGLHGAGQDQRPAGRARDGDRPVGALAFRHARHPQQVVVLLALERPGAHVDRIGDGAHGPQARWAVRQLSPGERRDPDLVGVLGVERPRFVLERAVDRVQDRDVDAVGHRDERVAGVVVEDVERPPAGRCVVDDRERPADVVDVV
jgi:hypothetical protein